MIITSKDNEIIKHIKKLQEKKYRDEFNEYIIEGLRLVNEAITEKAKIKRLILCKEYLANEIQEYNGEIIYVNTNVFDSISEVKNPQGVLAVVEKNNNNKEINYNEKIIIALDNVQDPGNIGTILRTIDSVRINSSNYF